MSLADCVYTYPHPAHRDSIIDCPGVPFPAYDQPDTAQVAVQQMLDGATGAFADAGTSSERVEVIRDLLAAWYAAWPASAVTDEHEGIAHQLVALVYAAEARAAACPCLPGAPKHRHGEGGYATGAPERPDWHHQIVFAGDGTWEIDAHPAYCPAARPCLVERLAKAQLADWLGVRRPLRGRFECAANDLGDRFLLGDRVDQTEGGCERCAAHLICPTHDDPRRSEG